MKVCIEVVDRLINGLTDRHCHPLLHGLKHDVLLFLLLIFDTFMYVVVLGAMRNKDE